jgi:hypothetical protein
LLIDDRGDFAVRVDGHELGLELISLADIDGMRNIGQRALFEHDGDLAAVGRRPGVQVDQDSLPGKSVDCNEVRR